MKKYLFLFFILFLISGCDVGIGGSKKSSKNSSTNQTNNISETNSTTITAVRVFTIAPVREALVTDSDNNIADFNISSGEYIFKSKVKYPVKAFSTASTFIDIDYDGKKSANDILPLTLKKGLKSYSNEINLVTDFEARIVEENLTKTKAQDPNTTITINTLLPFYDSQLNTKFDTNISANPLTNINLAETLFGAYNYIVEDKGVFAKIDDIDKNVNDVDNFFNNYIYPLFLTKENSVKYYSFYKSLLLLDKGKISRVDTIHKPVIPLYMRDAVNYTAQNNSVDIFDILLSNSKVFTASGHDEFIEMNNSFSIIYKSNPNLTSFGANLYADSFDNKKCLFLADGLNGFKTFDITNDSLIEYPAILKYNNIDNFTSDKVLSVNGYVSPLGNKRLLGISTSDKGFYLIDGKNSFDGCYLKKGTKTIEVNSTYSKTVTYDKNISSKNFLIDEETGKSISSAFRKDGTYLYVAKDSEGINGYDISILDSAVIGDPTVFALKNGESAYNLKLANNDNELFVTTDKGFQIYNLTSNSNSIEFVSEYDTEGAKIGYYPKIDFYSEKSLLFFTDGYKGLKVFKIGTSFEPMLCGIKYFSKKDDLASLAKVNSVKYDKNSNQIFVGVDSYGIVKFNLDDILFRHCK